MTLAEEIKQDILNNFNTLQNFNRTIDFVAKTLPLNQKVGILGIKCYYNSLFILNVNVEEDTINYMSMAIEAIELLEKLYSSNELFIYKFLMTRIQKNINKVKKVRLLA